MNCSNMKFLDRGKYVVYLFLLLDFLFWCIPLKAQTYHSNIFQLDSIVVVAKKVNGIDKLTTGQYQWKMENMKALPKIMGNSDPMHYVKFIPGVQTGSEIDSGIHMQGCDNEHNEISIFGVPVYQASHLLGLFSVFNPSHFSAMKVNLNTLPTASNKLGGSINMELINKPIKKVGGEFAIGPMSSQGTLRIPASERFSIVASVRQSYLNALYGRWLEFEGSKLRYSFSDYNLTFLYQPDKRNKFWFNSYYGYDDAKLNEERINSRIHVKWSNFLASLHWEHQFKSSELIQFVYLSRHENVLRLLQTDGNEEMPSDIQDIGYVADWKSKYIDVNAQAILHNIHPQVNEKVQSFFPTDNLFQRTQEYSLLANLHIPLGEQVEIGGGLKGCIYVDDYDKVYKDLLPKANLKFTPSFNLKFNLEYSYQKQYLFQTGITDMGMPTEFWSSCEEGILPQSAHSISLSSDWGFGRGAWGISSSVYYKKLNRQVEYVGTLMGLMDTDYRLKDKLLTGSGENYGINIMLNKRTGRLTGWMGYSWNRAFRYFDQPNFPAKYSANHERVHEFKTLLTYAINQRWEVGGTFVVASGLPFTAPKYYYSNNGQILTEYGPHNGGRLKPYYRMDVSVNYNIAKTNKKEQGINFSLYNASMHGNELFYRLRYVDSGFAYKPFKFLVLIMPSISYYYKF